MPFCLFRLRHTVGFKNQIESDVPANCHRWLWSWGGVAESVCQEGMLPHIWAVGLITQQVRGQQSQSWEKMRGRSRKDSCLNARPWGNLPPPLRSFPKLSSKHGHCFLSPRLLHESGPTPQDWKSTHVSITLREQNSALLMLCLVVNFGNPSQDGCFLLASFLLCSWSIPKYSK